MAGMRQVIPLLVALLLVSLTSGVVVKTTSPGYAEFTHRELNITVKVPIVILAERDINSTFFKKSQLMNSSTPPLVDVISPANNTDYFTNESAMNISLLGRVISANGISAVEYRLDGSGWATANLSPGDYNFVVKFSAVLENLTAGNHTLRIRATDSKGLSTSVVVLFNVETHTKGQWVYYVIPWEIVPSVPSSKIVTESGMKIEITTSTGSGCAYDPDYRQGNCVPRIKVYLPDGRLYADSGPGPFVHFSVPGKLNWRWLSGVGRTSDPSDCVYRWPWAIYRGVGLGIHEWGSGWLKINGIGLWVYEPISNTSLSRVKVYFRRASVSTCSSGDYDVDIVSAIRACENGSYGGDTGYVTASPLCLAGDRNPPTVLDIGYPVATHFQYRSTWVDYADGAYIKKISATQIINTSSPDPWKKCPKSIWTCCNGYGSSYPERKYCIWNGIELRRSKIVSDVSKLCVKVQDDLAYPLKFARRWGLGNDPLISGIREYMYRATPGLQAYFNGVPAEAQNEIVPWEETYGWSWSRIEFKSFPAGIYCIEPRNLNLTPNANNTVTVKVIDRAGRVTEKNFTIFYDAEPPAVRLNMLTEPITNNTVLREPYNYLNLRVNDESGLRGVFLAIENGELVFPANSTLHEQDGERVELFYPDYMSALPRSYSKSFILIPDPREKYTLLKIRVVDRAYNERLYVYNFTTGSMTVLTLESHVIGGRYNPTGNLGIFWGYIWTNERLNYRTLQLRINSGPWVRTSFTTVRGQPTWKIDNRWLMLIPNTFNTITVRVNRTDGTVVQQSWRIYYEERDSYLWDFNTNRSWEDFKKMFKIHYNPKKFYECYWKCDPGNPVRKGYLHLASKGRVECCGDRASVQSCSSYVVLEAGFSKPKHIQFEYSGRITVSIDRERLGGNKLKGAGECADGVCSFFISPGRHEITIASVGHGVTLNWDCWDGRTVTASVDNLRIQDISATIRYENGTRVFNVSTTFEGLNITNPDIKKVGSAYAIVQRGSSLSISGNVAPWASGNVEYMMDNSGNWKDTAYHCNSWCGWSSVWCCGGWDYTRWKFTDSLPPGGGWHSLKVRAYYPVYSSPSYIELPVHVYINNTEPEIHVTKPDLSKPAVYHGWCVDPGWYGSCDFYGSKVHIQATVSDSDGIKKVKVIEVLQNGKENSWDMGRTKGSTYSATAKLSCGTHTLKVRAYDRYMLYNETPEFRVYNCYRANVSLNLFVSQFGNHVFDVYMYLRLKSTYPPEAPYQSYITAYSKVFRNVPSVDTVTANFTDLTFKTELENAIRNLFSSNSDIRVSDFRSFLREAQNRLNSSSCPSHGWCIYTREVEF